MTYTLNEVIVRDVSTLDRLQHSVENFSIFFQGGVRRGILIFLGVCILLLAPFYYIGQFTALGVRGLWLDETLTINPKQFGFQPLQYSESRKTTLANGQQDLYVSVDNKRNKTIGFYPYVYSLQVVDKDGGLIKEETREEYILPEDIKFITVRDQSGRGDKLVITEERGTTPINFNALANPLQKTPEIVVSNESIEEIDGDRYVIRALFNNQDKQRIEKVDVIYFIRNRNQEVIGIGTGSFSGFTTNETRGFEAVHPKNASDKAQFVEVRWSVNYLDEDILKFN